MTKNLKDKIMLFLINLSAIITFLVLMWILYYVLKRGLPHINKDFILSTSKNFEDEGILPMILTTIYIILSSLVISLPIGIGAAIYLVEYAKNYKLVRIIRFTTESLAGIPSIIFGLFGMIFFVTFLKFGFSLLSGSITLSLMVLPTIIRTTEESLKSVPKEYKEGSLGLGASKIYTIYRVILKTATPGIITAVILSIGRIVGETAAVYLTAGMVPRVPGSLMDSGRTLSVHLYILAKEGISFDKSYATASILILTILCINLFANRFSNKLKQS